MVVVSASFPLPPPPNLLRLLPLLMPTVGVLVV
jgi:hypothetical protein